MARHETEMHRQRRIAIEALNRIARESTDQWAKVHARMTLDTIFPSPDMGLWADHSQIDLQDRKDIPKGYAYDPNPFAKARKL